MNENDKNCQLKTNFQGCFSKKMHIFLMFEANENFLLEMQIFSLAPILAASLMHNFAYLQYSKEAAK